MKRQFLSLMLLMLGTLFCHAQYSVLNGDLNHDGKITVEDITMMTNIVLQKSYSETIEAVTELSYGVPLAESAMLLNGKDFNTAIKQLVDPSAGFGTLDNTITKITFRKGSTDKGNIVSSSESPRTARATYNTETREITIYVDANKLIFPESCLCMFYFFGSVTQIDWSEFGTNIDTHNVTDMSGMFTSCSALSSLDFSHFNTNNVTDLFGMVAGCSALTTLDLSTFNTTNVTSMGSMFMYCFKLSSLNLGSNFTIQDECDILSMLDYTPNDKDTPYCIITCTSATQEKLRNSRTYIDESKILWDIL